MNPSQEKLMTNMAVRGTLIPIGGNEDKGFEDAENYRLDYIEEGILAHVVEEAGGVDAKIVVIPTASSIPHEVGENYLAAFAALGCNNVVVLNIRSTADAEKEASIKHIKTANCVMFSGGDQSKIFKHIGNTTVHEILLDRYKNESEFVIAGTSAGAMAMASEMIIGGSSKKAFVKGAVKMGEGLALIPELVIDTHFILRGRFGRILEAVAKHPTRTGFGFAEDTGMIIKNGHNCTVIGSGMVLVFDGSKLTHNNVRVLDEKTPITIANLNVHVLANGDQYDIFTHNVTVLPIEADFI